MDHSLQQPCQHPRIGFKSRSLPAHTACCVTTRAATAPAPPRPAPTRSTSSSRMSFAMDHYGIAKADILGLSMGGMTALGLAIDHPDRVGRVICCDARSDSIPPFVDSWNARVASIREAGGMKGVLDFTLGRGLPRTSIKSSRKSSRKREARFSPPIRRATSPASRPSRSSTTRAAWERFAPPLCSSSARRMRPLRRRCCARWRR
jgi:pimeloyl-ACP methyl ester carboxylesterase